MEGDYFRDGYFLPFSLELMNEEGILRIKNEHKLSKPADTTPRSKSPAHLEMLSAALKTGSTEIKLK